MKNNNMKTDTNKEILNLSNENVRINKARLKKEVENTSLGWSCVKSLVKMKICNN